VPPRHLGHVNVRSLKGTGPCGAPSAKRLREAGGTPTETPRLPRGHPEASNNGSTT